MDAVHAARVLMGDSLGFHIIFVMFGLTLPVLVVWFEIMALRKNDQQLRCVAHFWGKIMSLLVVTGVLSGTVIALQMSLVWPGILKFGGEVIGLPFMFETYAFLVEAIFLGLYMLTWNHKNLPKWAHVFFGFMVVLGSTASAYAITSVNGWMNLPVGFDIVDGAFTNVDVFAAMFSTTSIVTFLHSMPGYYLASGLFIAGLYAARLLRAKARDLPTAKYKLDYFIVQKLMIFVAIAFVGSAVTADLTGKYLAAHEPSKLAAIELLHETGPNAPLIVGGVSDGNGGINGPHFKIPGALSLLACNSPGCTVKGIDETPKNEQPPLIVHTFFDIKMTLITLLIIVVPLYFALRRWKPELLRNKLMLLGFVAISWVGIAIVELGWMMTEIGRQPWAVRGYVTVEEAFTKTHDITAFGYLFPLSYLVLFIMTVLSIRVLVRMEKSNAKGVLK
jgi:cytochrome d ubiquinol oxidase subunit I